jgi:hypothetical protein
MMKTTHTKNNKKIDWLVYTFKLKVLTTVETFFCFIRFPFLVLDAMILEESVLTIKNDLKAFLPSKYPKKIA